MGPTSSEARAIIAPILADKLVVGSIAVHLEDAAVAAEMSAHTFSGSAVLEAIGHHGWPAAAEGAVVAGIGPEPGLFHRAGAGREGRQAGFIGEDARALQDFAQHMRSEDLQLEADPAHPLRHQPPVDLHPVAGIDPFLPEQRQAIGIFGDRDLGQQCLGRQAAFDDVGRGERLDDAIRVLERIFRAAGHDDTEPGRNDIQPLRDVFADQHFLSARVFRQVLGFDHHLDPLEMGRKALARPRSLLLARGPALTCLRPQRRDAGLDLLEDEGLLRLFVSTSPSSAKLLGAPPEPGPVIGLQDLHQPLDPRVGIEAAGLQGRILVLQHGRLLRHGADHGLEQVHVIGQGKIVGAHAAEDSTSRLAMPRMIHVRSRGDSLCRSLVIQQIQALLPLRDEPVSNPGRRATP